MPPIRVWNSAVDAGHYGSVACLVRYVDRIGVLSASHVLTPVLRGVSPGANPRIRFSEDALRAELANWDVPITPDGLPLNGSFDAALAIVETGMEERLTGAVPLPAGLRRAETHAEAVYFFGATSGRCKHTTVHGVDNRVSMLYKLYDPHPSYHKVSVELAGLVQCDAKEPTEGGDSGCLLFDKDGYALGILLGTDPANVYPYFAPIEPILDAFGVQLVTSTEFPNAARLRDLIP